jgi:hypothetical protein
VFRAPASRRAALAAAGLAALARGPEAAARRRKPPWFVVAVYGVDLYFTFYDGDGPQVSVTASYRAAGLGPFDGRTLTGTVDLAAVPLGSETAMRSVIADWVRGRVSSSEPDGIDPARIDVAFL